MADLIGSAQKLGQSLGFLASPAAKPPQPLLKEKLRPASFRKIPFQVDSAEFEAGRRTQVHEYPQRDKPYAQDMGRATRHIEFDAFVVGPDYVDKANALIGALEEYGPGTLVHPWFGSLKVNVERPARVSFNGELGLAKLQLAFVESGELTFPSSAQSTAAQSRKAAENLETESVSWFASAVAFANQVSDVAAQALTLYGQVLAFIANPAFALANMLGFGSLLGNLNSLSALFGAPLSLGWSFAGMLNLSAKAKDGTLTGGSVSGSSATGTVSTTGASSASAAATSAASADSALIAVVRGLTRMAVDPVLAAPPAHAYITATTAQIHQNRTAILANARQLLLVQAVGLSSYIKCAIYDDAMAARDELSSALDAEAMQCTDDNLYQAIVAARAAIWQDLTERSRDSARLTTITPPEVLPMLAIAYDYYEDVGRDGEIVDRNKIRHPGFVPVAPLKVLS